MRDPPWGGALDDRVKLVRGGDQLVIEHTVRGVRDSRPLAHPIGSPGTVIGPTAEMLKADPRLRCYQACAIVLPLSDLDEAALRGPNASDGRT